VVPVLEGIASDHLGFQMDVCCRDHRNFPDAFLCIYGTCGMASTWILCLLTIGIDVGMPFGPPNHFNSELDRDRFL